MTKYWNSRDNFTAFLILRFDKAWLVSTFTKLWLLSISVFWLQKAGCSRSKACSFRRCGLANSLLGCSILSVSCGSISFSKYSLAFLSSSPALVRPNPKSSSRSESSRRSAIEMSSDFGSLLPVRAWYIGYIYEIKSVQLLYVPSSDHTDNKSSLEPSQLSTATSSLHM